MSINITVTGNPINVRPCRAVLSDLEQIKKTERDRRKRLRLEQVRQQSKERSSQIVEKAKLIEQQELEKLQNDKDSELRLLHSQRLQSMQQKYRDDLENIGHAHISAAQQPNVDQILEANRKRNRSAALERGREATRRLRESSKKKEKQSNALKNRKRNIRESENVRASMISQLSRLTSNEEDKTSIVSDDEEEDSGVLGQQNVRVISAIVHQVDDSSDSPIQPYEHSSKKIQHRSEQANKKTQHGSPKKPSEQFNKVTQYEKPSEASKRTQHGSPKRSKSVGIEAVNIVSESDDQEPRRIVPGINILVSKRDKIASYNPEDYRGPTSEDSSSGSSSGESSHSVIVQETISSRNHYSQVHSGSSQVQSGSNQVPSGSSQTASGSSQTQSSQVQRYDLVKRREDQYPMPSGTVEKVNKNIKNAEDEAKDVARTEQYHAKWNEIRKAAAENRGKDALLREKVRRDQAQLCQTLDHYCSEERKLKASQVQNEPLHDPHMHPSRKKNHLKKRQNKIERNIESIMRKNTSSKNGRSVLLPTERIITSTRSPEEALPTSHQPTASSTLHQPTTPSVYEPRISLSAPNSTNQTLHYEEILEMLKRLERTKYKLWVEYSSSLPESVSQKPLWQQQLTALIADGTKVQEKEPEVTAKPASGSPEIRVINVSLENEKKKKKKAKTQVTEIAVQTSLDKGATQHDDAQDKSVQVEMSREKERMASEEKQQYLEPAIKIVAQTENVDSGSSVSSGTDLLIDVDGQQVKVTPKTKHKKPKLNVVTRRSSRHKTKGVKKSVVVSTPKSMRSTLSPVKETVDAATSPRIETSEERQTSSCNSTEVSQIYSVNETPKEGAPYTLRTCRSKQILKIRQTSDSSTSYTSPPTVKKGAYLVLADNSTPVLELLDSSISGTEKIRKQNVSPVSSPETPSPRTMKLASNIPVGTMRRRALFRQSKTSREVQVQKANWTDWETPATSGEKECNCSNPSCRLFHRIFDNDNNSEEVNRKLEELQNKTKGKIANLSELINKLRGLDLSMLNDIPTPDSTSVNNQIAQDYIVQIEALHEVIKKNLLESQRLVNNRAELSTAGTVLPLNADNARGDDQIIDLPTFNKPKITSDKHILIEQNEKDETMSRLLTEILKQIENGSKRDSDESSSKLVDIISNLQVNKEVPSAMGFQDKLSNGRKILPIEEPSTIQEFDTPDAIGPKPFIISKKLRTSTPTKPPPENKSTQVVTPKTSDFSGQDQISSPSSENNKGTSSDFSGFSGISGISKGDSQNSIEKQLYEKVSWAGATVKKTRESAALDSSSTSEACPANAQRSLPMKKLSELEFPGLTDVSSISLRNANKSTEQSILQKARTSTPNIQTSGTTDCSDMTTTPSMELT